MAYPGGPRPGTGPPNYNPNSLSESMQNLNVNRPSGPRPPPQQFPGQSPMVRPGPPPPGVRPTFPPSGTQMPPSIAPNRPSGPSPPFGSRPSPPGPYSQGNSPIARPNTSPFGSSPMTRVPGPGPISNGPPMAPQGAPRFPSTGNFPPQQGQMPFSNRGPSPPPPMGMRPVVGSMPTASPRGQVQPPQFSAPPQGMPPASGSSPFFAGRPPPMGSSPFGAPPQGGAPPVGSPYAPPPWQMQQGQRSEQLYFELTDARDKLLSRDQNAAVVNVFQLGVDISMVPPPPSVPGAMQPPRMFGMQPPNQSMSSGMGGSPSKVDPNQIPRPIPSNPVILHETRQGNQANPPPPATSSYIVKDTGNCSPRYMRCTINQVPCTVEILTTSGMQLALMVQPLAMPHPSEESIQVVDFGESGPVRCSRCKGYINPFMKFIDQGKRFICNFCGSTEETPREYHCNLGPDGRRRDADERAELCRGTVEFVATKEYMVRDPMPAVYFFLIDVSLNAIQTGATAAACSAINQVIADLPEGPRTMVGVATYDSTIHFYNMKRALQQPLMLIVPDIQDVYTPLESDVIVQLSECRQHLELLLECIPSMFQSNKTADSAFGAAVKAAFLALKSTGGKLLVFQTVLPSVGLGALSAREAEGRTNVSFAEKEANKLLQPVDKTLNTMATELAEYQVCVDIFVTAQSYVDIASLSVIPRTTGGQVYYYHPFSAISDSAKLFNDLKWNVTRPQGFEAVMRVRCSQGIQVQDYSGNFCKRIPTDVDLPAIDCDKTIMVTMKHDDKLQDGSECAFQCALLYTTVYGERRIRVSTLSLPCTSLISNLFRSADLDTQFACFLKQAANEIPTSPLSQVRDKVTNLCIAVLFSYRKFCATVSSAGQLILPEALKLLPLYTLALVKSVGLRHDGRIDDRSFWINYVSFLSTPLAIPLVYPRMMAIHDLDVKEMDGSLPPVIPLSSEHISDSGIYLLENGDDCLIYIGNTVDPSILQRLFGISSVDEVPTQFVLQQYDNPLSKKLNDVVNEIRRQRCSYLRLKLCKKGDPSGMMFLSYMVEDKTITGHSYVEFLVHVHRQIQNKMSV